MSERPEIHCPQCGHLFQTPDDSIHSLNVACGATTIDKPEVVENGYAFCFLGYSADFHSIDLYGPCVALPEDRDRYKPAFYILCGSTVPSRIKEGECLCFNDMGPSIHLVIGMDTRVAVDPGGLVSLKKETMQILRDFIAKKVQVAA